MSRTEKQTQSEQESVRDRERYWQNYWEEHGIFNGAVDRDNPFYVLTMFPYPSGKQLHLGHWFQYGMMDSWTRFQKLRGKNVFQPMGFDSFGLPAENYAIKRGIHPEISTKQNIETMRRQYKEMGTAYDWKHTLNTSSPEYYKWTQWLFITLMKNGLAFQKEAPVNWCPECKTVLANEQVISGKCERCDSAVFQKKLKQWFFRITNYAGELLEGLDELDWPEKTKAMQRHWIGESKGALITFKTQTDTDITVFTTRPDTIFGVTYIVLAPDHPMVPNLTEPAMKETVSNYQEQTRKKTELERIQGGNGKSGVPTGGCCEHPFTGEKLPVWISDYVLMQYGTGAVMGVPGEDQRDRDFSVVFNLPVKDTGFPSGWDMDRIMNHSTVQVKTTYRLRDWLVSRQRYWGAPIPVIHCQKCGAVPVPESDLPVLLPKDADFSVAGSPLGHHEEFLSCSCPRCGQSARRESDTLDTFVCSSWYFLRFPDPHYSTGPFNRELVEKCLPLARYCGGPEHACMHLLYARFITRVFHQLGYISFQEPFPHLTHQGLILGENGEKMSKSKDALSPDPYVERYGSDVLRLYLHFGFNFTEGGPWNENGVKAIRKFVQRIRSFYQQYLDLKNNSAGPPEQKSPVKSEGSEGNTLQHRYHYTIQQVTRDTDRFMFNTSVARLMELLHEMTRGVTQVTSIGSRKYDKTPLDIAAGNFPILLAPYAPHLAEELWFLLGNSTSVFQQSWPEWDETLLAQDTVTMAVMVNGKRRGEITVDAAMEDRDLSETAEGHDNVQTYIHGKNIVKRIIVPGKLINLITE